MSQNAAKSRGQELQAHPGSGWSAGEAHSKAPEVDALKSISASISDDFSHKDKVESRQLSALQNSTQRLGHNATLSRSSGPGQIAAQAMRRPRRPPGFADSRGMPPPPPGLTGSMGMPPPTPEIGGQPPPPPPMGFPARGPPVDEDARWWTTPTSLAPPTDQTKFHIHESAAEEARDIHTRKLMGARQASEVGRNVNSNDPNRLSLANAPDTASLKSAHQSNTHNSAQNTCRPQEKISRLLSEDSHARPQKRPRSEQTSRTGIPLDVESLDSQALKDLIEKLQERSRQLGIEQGSIQPPCKYLTLHRLEDSRRRSTHIQQPHSWPLQKSAFRKSPLALYFDAPQTTSGQDGQRMLRSQLPVTNFDLYLEQNKDISFVVYKTYEMPQDTSKNKLKGPRRTFGHNSSDAKVHESIQPVNEALMNAVAALLEAEDGYESILMDFRETSELFYPYLFVFHRRDEWDSIRRSLPESCHHQMTMLWNYIVQSQGAEYAAAETMIANNKIAPGLLKYLFKPGQLLVQKGPEGMQGLVCIDWPEAMHQRGILSRKPGSIFQNKSHDTGSNRSLELNAWHWEFDGAFRRKKVTLTVSIGSGTNEELGTPIDTLNIFPLAFASRDTIEQIQCRGKSFWKCRRRALVSYKGADTNDDSLVSSADFHGSQSDTS